MLSIDTDFPAGAYEAVTIATTAVGFTSKYITADGEGENKDAREVFCTLETASIRYTLDGTTPTTSVGHRLAKDTSLELKNRNDIVNFRAITIATTASLKVTYRY